LTQESPTNGKNVKKQPNDQVACDERDRQNEIDDSSDGNSASNDRISADNRAEPKAVKFLDV